MGETSPDPCNLADDCMFKNISDVNAKKLIAEAVKEAFKNEGLAPGDLKSVSELLSDWRSLTTGTKQTALYMLQGAWRSLCRISGYLFLAYICWKSGILDGEGLKKVLP